MTRPRTNTLVELPTYVLLSLGLIFVWSSVAQPQVQPGERAERARRMSHEAEERGLAEPFKGVTRDGNVTPGLFSVRSTGVSTEPVREAAVAFLSSLTPDQRAKTMFPVDDVEWRKWMNQSFYIRQGMGFGEMTDRQRQAALALLRASLSAKGLQQSQDIMRLNHTLGELNGDDFERFSEDLYWITVMGEPSAEKPWGWQLDGHHLAINYFVLADQVVMTPTFMGSEPAIAHAGKYKGTAVLQVEQSKGLDFINALDDAQRGQAIIRSSKSGADSLAEAFKDNLVLDYAGINARNLTAEQKDRLVDLIAEYVSNMSDGHAKVKMAEVRQHLDDTYFAWIGGTAPSSVFYYRIHSPVILIEFDHQAPFSMPGTEKGKPIQEHIHSVVRTPNGNDYGKDLLRQHYGEHPHPHPHPHPK